VPLAAWLGRRLRKPLEYDESEDELLTHDARWPDAAWGDGAKRYRSQASAWPVRRRGRTLRDFLRFPVRPLSAKAASGFYARVTASRLNFDPAFLRALVRYVHVVSRSEEGRPV
jgi:DNA (cytosine-5)-methyltransferase 1